MARAIVAFPDEPPREFANPVATYVAYDTGDVRNILDAADRAAASGLHCVGFVAYDAAPAFDPAFRVASEAAGERDYLATHRPPLAWFAAFESVQDPSPPSPEAPPPASPPPSLPQPKPAIPPFHQTVSRADHHRIVTAIRDAIALGDVYQVNYAFPLFAGGGDALARVDPVALWHHLRAAQPNAYAAFIDTGDHVIVSASPELFFDRNDTRIVVRPMKGTAPRGRWLAEDDARARGLASSEKERAENIMIVDLVRNDLARVSEVGSVRVERLCEVERFPTVLQMTSTVSSRLQPGKSTADIFAALFPCGSITGAPKIAAMQHIAALERASRGVYCGAIGYIAPAPPPRARSIFSVAIRTAIMHEGDATYGVGGGITWDSDADAEYDEAILKALVLDPKRVFDDKHAAHHPARFELVETMRLDHGACARLDRHLARLRDSARYFGWPDPTPSAGLALNDIIRPGTWRIRLAVGLPSVPISGSLSAAAPCSIRIDVDPAPTDISLVATIAPHPVDSSHPFLFHKTTRSTLHSSAPSPFTRRNLELFMNERGELTEFTFGNLVLELDGNRYTPPVDAGLLPGVLRAELLERGELRERTLTLGDLKRATGVWLINSLRGSVAVSFAPDGVASQ